MVFIPLPPGHAPVQVPGPIPPVRKARPGTSCEGEGAPGTGGWRLIPPRRGTYTHAVNEITAPAPTTPAPTPERQRSQDWLARGGLRPTRQRLALAEILAGDGLDRHVTAESLFAAVTGTGEKVSLATVYNTLRAFCAAGLLREIAVDSSRSYFDTRTDTHPHFLWEEDNRLTDAPAEALRFASLPEPPPGTVISHVDVIIRIRRD